MKIFIIKKLIISCVCVFFLMYGFALFGPTNAQTQKPPQMQMPQMELHDPYIFADNKSKTYYLFTSNIPRLSGEETIGIMVYKSKDLQNWEKPKIAFRLPSNIWANGGAWAPEVHFINNRYHMFLTLHNEAMKLPKNGKLSPYRRATIRAVSNSPDNEFIAANNGDPVVNPNFMTLDGTYFRDRDNKRYFIYSREWLDVENGEMHAQRIGRNFRPIGAPIILFRGSDSSDTKVQVQPDGVRAIVTDGPQLYRTSDDSLIMLWSSWGHDGYIQTIARSRTGLVTGPWEQLPRLLGQNSGHGMIFTTFEGKKLLIVHRPFKNARGKLYEVLDKGNTIELGRQLTEIDGGG